MIKGHLRHTGSTKVSNFVKLNFYHFWPLCNTKNANFAIFHAKKLKFSPQNRCLSFAKTQWSHSFIDYWPFLTTVHHQKCQLCHFSWYRAEIFTTVPLSTLFQITVVIILSNWLFTMFEHCETKFQIDFWSLLTTVQQKMQTLPYFMLESWNFQQRTLAWSIS